MMINGYQVFAVLPNLWAGGIDGYIVAAERPTGEAVVAWVRSLDAANWSHGDYFVSPDTMVNRANALARMPARASGATVEALRDAVDRVDAV